MIAISFASWWPCSCPGWGMVFIFSGHRLELTLIELARYANSFTRYSCGRSDNGCTVRSMGPVFPFGQMSLSPELQVSVEKINSKIHCFGLASLQTPLISGRVGAGRCQKATDESCPRVNLRGSLHGRVVAACFCNEEKGEGVETRIWYHSAGRKNYILVP